MRTDRAVRWILLGATALAGSVLLWIAFFLVREALPAMAPIGRGSFLTGTSWHPSEGLYGMLPMVLGTLAVTLGGILLAAPMGVAAAIYMQHFSSPRVAGAFRRMIELLAGVPSVVFGFWGLVVLAPLLARVQPPGTNLLAGIVVVGIMILPTVALLSDGALERVPREYLLGAASLGMTPEATILQVVLPAARSGISTGILLATARAIGETMAVLMVCGNVVAMPHGFFDPVRTLTANIALEMSYAMGDHRSALFLSALLLMGMVVVLVGLAELSREVVHEHR